MHLSVYKPVQAIFFDLDNTLIDRNGALRRYLPQWLAAHCPTVPEEEYAAEAEKIMQADGWGYTDRRVFCGWLLGTYGINSGKVDSLWNDFLHHIPRQLVPEPAVLSMLSQLKATLPIGIISNGSGKTQRAKMNRAGFTGLFDDQLVLISGEVGPEKPDAALFIEAAGRASIAPVHILYVGDHPENDVAGAALAGMQTCWVAGGRSKALLTIRPDLVLDHITDLLPLVLYATT